MRYIRYAILAAIAVIMITVALANRAPVTLNLMPEGLASLLRYPGAANTLTLPLFVVILFGIVAGVLLGFVWEWLREHKHRAEVSRQKRENVRLAREVAKMKSDPGPGDDVLAMLEDNRAAR
ncbi:MAG: LapA family protein [Rhodobacter sp.]|nr:LapA family protein [Rhodobacter sp.]